MRSCSCSACSHTFYCAYLLIVVLEVRDQATYASALIVLSLLATLAFSSVLDLFVAKPCIALGRRLGRTFVTKPRDAAVSA